MGAQSPLIYALAAALCALYTLDTLVVAYNYRFHASNPASSKLLFYAEAVKLLLATCFLLSEQGGAGYALYQRLSGDAQQLLPHAKGGKHTQGWRAGLGEALVSWLRAMAVFAVPAACYFVTNNLCFYALQIMPAHTYTLLSDLKIITTGVLSYLLLDKQLNRRAATCLLLLFTGICLGQYGTSGGSGSKAATPLLGGPGPLHWLHGVLVMSLVAVLSAVAAVYTEWVMNHSDGYKHESINLQNMRLYASGTLFNGLYCVSRGAGSLSSFADMRPSHWLIVMGLAFMGLVTSLVIKRYGNVVKVYASCIASLVAAGASSWVLHDPPTPVFFIGCVMAMTATFQFRATGQQSQPAPAPAAANGHQPDSKQQPGSPQAGARAWRATAFIPTIAGLVLVLFLACQATRPTNLSSSSTPNQPMQSLGNTTDAPMMAQVGDGSFPVAQNYEEVFNSTYGY